LEVNLSLTKHPPPGASAADEPVVASDTVREQKPIIQVDQLLERIADAYVALDTELRFVLVNNNAVKVLERTTEDLLGANIWDIFPDGMHGPIQQAFREAADTGKPVQVESFCAILKRWFENRIYPESFGFSIFFQDVSERRKADEERKQSESSLRESEKWLRLALASGKLGSYHLDLRTNEFLDISDAYLANFGYAPGATFTYSMLSEIIHPEDRPHVRAVTQAGIDNHQDYFVEGRCIWPDGSIHWISAHGSPVYDEDGMPIRLIGVTQDVSERKRYEEEQAQTLKEAHERADRDPLTDLLNHRAFYKRLEEECARARREDTVLSVVMLDLDNFQFFNDVYGHAIGDKVLRQVAERLQAICRPYDTIARFGGDEFSLLLSNVGYSTIREIESRLNRDLAGLVYQPEGQEIAIPITLALGASLFDLQSPDRHEVVRMAHERLRWLKAGGEPDEEAESVRNAVLKSVDGFSMLDALVAAVDNKDRYTRRHSEDVMAYSLMIARELGLDEKTQQTIAIASLLHDVGKIGVPDAILRKPSSLTREEFEAVRQHPEMGAIIVSAVPGLEATLGAVRHHHECWDGTGYPSGLRGEETPLMARLMAVADAYNAMTTNRPYRQAMDVSKAISILENGAGTQWDPTCVQAFITALKRQETYPPIATGG